MEEYKAVVVADSAPGWGHLSFVRRQAIELVSIVNRPILFRALEAVGEAGIVDVALVVHVQTGEEIREIVGDGSDWGLRVSYIVRREPGLVHALQAAEGVLGDSPFVVYPGNGILTAPLQPLLRHFRRRRLQALLPLVDPAAPGGGKAEAKSGAPMAQALARTVDGYNGPMPDGVYVFGPSIHVAARAATPSWRGQLELADVIQALLDDNARVEARQMELWWAFHGHTDELLEGNRLLLDRLIDKREDALIEDTRIEGRVAISASARAESTMIRGPAIIGPGARLADAYIGPYTSVGRAALVRGAEVENSIIMAGAEVKDVGARVADSVIGEGAVVDRDFSLPRVLALAVAHGSTAMLG